MTGKYISFYMEGHKLKFDSNLKEKYSLGLLCGKLSVGWWWRRVLRAEGESAWGEELSGVRVHSGRLSQHTQCSPWSESPPQWLWIQVKRQVAFYYYYYYHHYCTQMVSAPWNVSGNLAEFPSSFLPSGARTVRESHSTVVMIGGRWSGGTQEQTVDFHNTFKHSPFSFILFFFYFLN